MAKDTLLKRKLVEAGISQREVARRTHRHFQHVNYVVNGVRKSRKLSFQILELCNEQVHLRNTLTTRRANQIRKATI